MMEDFNSIQFRKPQQYFLNNDFKNLSTIKLNPNIRLDDCQRVIDLLNGVTKTVIAKSVANVSKNVSAESKEIVRRKELNFHNESPKVGQLSTSQQKHSLDSDCETNLTKKMKFDDKCVFQVVYGKYKPYKKNKEWTFDGFVLIAPNEIQLFNCSGQCKGRTERLGNNIPKIFEDGVRIVIGSFECELCGQLDVSEFESGSYFANDYQD